jgi:hypothetical protein
MTLNEQRKRHSVQRMTLSMNAKPLLVNQMMLHEHRTPHFEDQMTLLMDKKPLFETKAAALERSPGKIVPGRIRDQG